MAWNDEDINTYVRDLITPMLHSSFVSAKPLLSWLIGSAATNKEKLGDPKVGAFFGGQDMGIGERSEMAGSKTHKFRYQKSQTDAASVVTAGGSTPVASGFAEDNVGSAGVNWTHFWNPLKIREDSLLNARNSGTSEGKAIMIASIMEEAVGFGFQRSLEKQQAELWTDTLSSAEQAQDTQTWNGYIGLQHWVDDGVHLAAAATVGSVDRTAETELKASAINADAGFTNDVLTIRMLRQVRLLDQPGGSGGTTHPNGAPRKRQANAGQLVILPPDLWEVLADECDGKNQINSNDIRPFAVAGFTNPVLRIDDMVVVWDHDCPAGEAYVLTPDSWVFEIQQGANFTIEPWTRKWTAEEGGHYYRWTNIHAKARLICRKPWLQTKIYGLDTS